MRLPTPLSRLRAWRARARVSLSRAGLAWRARATHLHARLRTLPILGPCLRATDAAAAVTTRLGRGLLLTVILALATALATKWAEAWAVTLVTAVLFLAGIPFILGRSRYTVTVDLNSTRVTVGEAAVGEVRVESQGRCAASLLELPVGAGLAEFRIPSLAEGATHSELFTVPTRRRGVIPIGPATSVRGDALGAFRRRHQWNEAIELFVHPRTVTLGTEVLGFMRDIEGALTQDLSSSDVSFHALREYIPGDDRRHIHWKSTARTGRLLVRQFEETRRAHLLVVLDLNADSWVGEDDFETAVAAAASLIVAMHRAGRDVSLVTAQGKALIPTAMRALDHLSRVETDPQLPDLTATARRAADTVPEASVCALLTGAATTMDTLHRATSAMPLSASTWVIQVDGSAAARTRHVAGVPVGVIPDLEALPMVLRRVVS